MIGRMPQLYEPPKKDRSKWLQEVKDEKEEADQVKEQLKFEEMIAAKGQSKKKRSKPAYLQAITQVNLLTPFLSSDVDPIFSPLNMHPNSPK